MVRLSHVAVAGKKVASCLVHIPSIKKLVATAKPSAGVKVEVGLKYVNYGDDDWGCKGGGSDCIVTVEVPDV
jgi:hypothetical protein